MKKWELDKGITLIALVITIIVLLILAAVSISTLTGENGILTKASTAKENTEREAAKEKVQMAVLASYGTDGTIDVNQLESNLEKVEGIEKPLPNITSDSLETGITVKVDGYEVTITGDGNVTGNNPSDDMQAKKWIQKGGKITKGNIEIRVGDYVNYNHLEGVNTENGEAVTYTSDLLKNGYGEQSFDIREYTGEWQVLGAEDGKLLLISSDMVKPQGEDKFSLAGANGYLNAVSELDKISSKYGQGTYAEGARSIKLEDVDKITGFNPNNMGVIDFEKTGNGDKFGNGYRLEYGNEVTYSLTTNGKVSYASKNGDSGVGEANKFDYFDENNQINNLQQGETKKYVSYYQTYNPETLSASIGAPIISGKDEGGYQLLFNNNYNIAYWLATSSIYLEKGYVRFGAYCVTGKEVYSFDTCTSQDMSVLLPKEAFVRPVVILESDVKLVKESEKNWTLNKN